MLGDFRYCSSSSESSDEEADSDFSDRSDDYIEKLVVQRKVLEDKVKERENKLRQIQNTLKVLNEERKRLFAQRNELVTNETEDLDVERMLAKEAKRVESEELILPSTSTEPLNLNPIVRSENDEEFDSDNES